jgi:SNF2 family DNA or RNA helicase
MIEEIIPQSVALQINHDNIIFIDKTNNNFANFPSFVIQQHYVFFNELESLSTYGGITNEENKIIVDNEYVYKYFTDDQNTEEKVNFNNLLLNVDKNIEIRIRLKGTLASKNCEFEYKIKPKHDKFSVALHGIAYKENAKIYIIPKAIYEAIKIINLHLQLQNKTFDDNWRTAFILKDLKEKNKCVLLDGSFLDGINGGYIDGDVELESSIDKENNILVSPYFTNLSESDNIKLRENINSSNTVKGIYSYVNSEGKRIRVLLPKEYHETIQAIIDKPKLVSEKDKKNFLINPSLIYGSGIKLSLKNFSERVVGFGIVDDEAIGAGSSGIDWMFPIELHFTDTNDKPKTRIIVNNEDKDIFVRNVKKQRKAHESYFSIGSAICPFTPSNLEELKKIVNLEDKDKTESYLELYDQAGDKHLIYKSANKEIAQEIAQLIKKNKNELDGVTYEILSRYIVKGTSNVIIPLSKENVTEVFKAVKTGLLINTEEIEIVEDNLLANIPKIDMELPITLQLKLKAHQENGVSWLQNSYALNKQGFRYEGVMLADDMGLGKTLQALTFLENLRLKHNNNKPFLIVAPVVLLSNWKNEYHKFFRNIGKIEILHGENINNYKILGNTSVETKNLYFDDETVLGNLDGDKLKTNDVIVTNYDTLVNYQNTFGSINWHVVVLDEAQAIKNPGTAVARATKALNADFKIAMTGTPVENSLLDIWSIFDFLDRRVLPPLKKFKEIFVNQVDSDNIKKLKDYLRYDKTFPYLIRRNKSDVLDDLPSKININQNVELKDEYFQAFIKVKENMFVEGHLAALGRLNLLHQSYELFQEKSLDHEETITEFINSPKGIELINILSQIKARNEKVLIFAIYKNVQLLLQKVLYIKFNIRTDIINGSVAVKNRDKIIEKFEQDNSKFALILSSKAAGVGLNLVMANNVIHYGRWWNPATENQATDRVYRIGQTKEVKVYYITYIDRFKKYRTFDENLNELINNKKEMAQDFLTPTIDLAYELSANINNSKA